MAAGAAHGDRADDHQLVQALGVGKSVTCGGHVAPAEDLRSGTSSPRRAVSCVLWSLGVDHRAFQHALHLAFDLVEQGVEVAGFEEGGDVVVGVETLAGAGCARGCAPKPAHRGFCGKSLMIVLLGSC